jgi:phage terminase small subunit
MPATNKANLDVRYSRLKPPATLPKGPATIFRQIVGACDAKHFTPADTPLLVEYARAVDLAGKAAAELERDGAVVAGKANPWLVVQEKAQRALVALSARLRLCPQSRFDRLVAATTSRFQGGRKPWEWPPEDPRGPDPLDEFPVAGEPSAEEKFMTTLRPPKG